MEKIIGIIGGMGPEATADLFMKIIRSTPVGKDQDHIRVMIDSNSKIPDRIKAVFEGGENPLPHMVESARILEKAGAGIILIACNGAHFYYEGVSDSVSVKVLNIMEETAIYCKNVLPQVESFGLLATDATIRGGLYENAFLKHGRKILTPEAKDQKTVMECIYKVKSGVPGSELKDTMISVSRNLGKRGCSAIILGCTEIPLIMEDGDMDIPIVDPTLVLAQSAVLKAKGLQD